MKYTKILMLGILCAAMLSCGSDDEDGGAMTDNTDFTTIAEGTISAKNDDVAWASILISALSSTASSSITATSVNQDILFITLANTDIGTYNVGGEINTTTISYRTLNGSENFSTLNRPDASGSMTIVERDVASKTISGYFSTTMIDDSGAMKEFTEGLFNKIKYDN